MVYTSAIPANRRTNGPGSKSFGCQTNRSDDFIEFDRSVEYEQGDFMESERMYHQVLVPINLFGGFRLSEVVFAGNNTPLSTRRK